MGYSNGKVTPPITMKDVELAVGVPQTAGLSAQCKSSNLNMWAKYKPVRKAVIDTTPQLNQQKTYWNPVVDNPWWAATDGNFGLVFTKYAIGTGSSSMSTQLSALANAINGGMNGWGYEKPNGGSTAPYRLLDFLGYNSNAPRPVSSMRGDSAVQGTTNSVWTYSIQYRESDDQVSPQSRDYLVMSDLGKTKKGLLICKKNSSTNKYEAMAWTTGYSWDGLGVKSASTADGITGSGPDFDIATFKNGGTYYVIPILFGNNNNQNLDDIFLQTYPSQSKKPSDAYSWVATIPNTSFMSFTASQVASAQNIGYPCISNHQIIAAQGASNGAWASRVYIDSSYSSYYHGGTIPTLTIGVVNENWNGTFATGNYAALVTKSNVSIPANTKQQVYYWGSGGDASALTLALSHTWRVIIILSNDGYKNQIRLIAPEDPVTPT